MNSLVSNYKKHTTLILMPVSTRVLRVPCVWLAAGRSLD